MKKKIYFKERWDSFPNKDTKRNDYCCEIFWKSFRWWPFWKKMDGVFNAQQKMSIFLKYDAEYRVFVWDEIFSQFVPLRYML